ncbi:MAG: histone deacetylase [Myxococcota bacterium]
MSVLLLFDELFLEHDPGPFHPESTARLPAILQALERRPISGTQLVKPPPATVEELTRIHQRAYVDRIVSLKGEYAQLDPDTVLSPSSTEAAVLAAGAAMEGVRRVLGGEARSAFVLCRPPGHHAEESQGMGFCVFNNIALAAAEAHARGLTRVLVVDWDVHHGNGTQHSFEDKRELLFMSTHQFPFYPGSGAHTEVGRGAGEGFTVNVPLIRGCTDGDYAAVFRELLMPIADAYRPELVLVSAGFDAHADDPLGGMNVSTEGFAWMAHAVKQVADKHCAGRMVLTLEGGYDVNALADSVHAVTEVLCGAGAPSLRGPRTPMGEASLDNAREVQRRYWDVP